MRLHEITLIERLRRLAGMRKRSEKQSSLKLLQGIGDDCAVARHSRTHDLLVTTDLFIEDIHFRRAWQSAGSVGHKVLTRGLSDIAAMGGTPRLAFLSFALPRTTNQRWVDSFLKGFLSLARQHNVTLAGGDTSSSPAGFMADIIVLGDVPKGQAVMRSGARAGDEIWVTGKLGGAAFALANLSAGKRVSSGRSSSNPYFFPQARVHVGEYLRSRRLASAMMDLSDGLSIDLLRLCKTSETGAIIDEKAIPTPRLTPMQYALDGGDDFELLFTVPAKKTHLMPEAVDGISLTRIGIITATAGLRIVRNGKERLLPTRGYQHF